MRPPLVANREGEQISIAAVGGGFARTFPIKRVVHSDYLVKPFGNAKTQGKVGFVGNLSYACFRSVTGFEKSEVACYSCPGSKGCYANDTIHAAFHKWAGFDVAWNGVREGTERFFLLKLPKNDDFVLKPSRPRVWRIDSESSDSSLSLALGFTQLWAEANPRKVFTGISSDYFWVPDEKLEWASRCGNIVIGHTLSPWFSQDENRNRIEQLRRFVEFELPSTVWFATREDWGVPWFSSLLEEAISIVGEKAVIEVPYHTKGFQEGHSLHVNPMGGCCEIHTNSRGRLIDDLSTWEGAFYGKCAAGGRSCSLLCGAYLCKNKPRLK